MKLRLANPPILVDIGGLKELVGIKAAGDALEIGALTTHAAVSASAAVRSGCPILADTAGQIGDVQVRNRGTIGGSLAHADPAADLPTVMVALGATVRARGGSASRDLPAAGFFLELLTTALKPGEILTAVSVPTYGKGTGAAYLKHRHPASSYAVVGVAAVLTLAKGACARVSLVVGGATVNPVHAKAAEAALAGQAPSEAAIAAAAGTVPSALANPRSDHYASGEFRLHLAEVLARRALTAAAERAKA
jgi:carbon-monoxide dehydrogenase medium subunit